LVGHSLGAAVAAELALLRPGIARSLTMIAPAGLPGSPLSEDFLAGLVEAQNSRQLKRVLDALVADAGLISKDMVEDLMRFKRLDGAEEALALLRDRMVEGSDFRALQNRLSELPAVLVICGRNDRIVGVPDQAALPGNWRIAWVEDAGHMPHLERAAEVNALILDEINGS
jgi:pyruvate dehydrogenase E2 component (dihydrolipoamide acetyltransferase)